MSRPDPHDAAFQVAMRAGELVIASDGLEQLRPYRQAVLASLKLYRDAVGAMLQQDALLPVSAAGIPLTRRAL